MRRRHPGFRLSVGEQRVCPSVVPNAGCALSARRLPVIDAIGNKAAARRLMKAPRRAGGARLKRTGRHGRRGGAPWEQLGYPVLVKAAAGGGGRGMRRAYSADELPAAFAPLRRRRCPALATGEMYLEKLIVNPRHIEFQILADSHGHVVHLGGRDCSIQRKNQKLMEEAPSKALTPSLREAMGQAAVEAARAARLKARGRWNSSWTARGISTSSR